MQQVVYYFDVLGRCAERKTCHRNYRLGNRASRVCRSCPLHDAIGANYVEGAVKDIYEVQEFYRKLDWRAEDEKQYGQVMMKRTYHTVIFDTAYLSSKLTANGLPRADDRGFLSLASLFRTMIASLARYPLRSEFEPEPWNTLLPAVPIHPEVMSALFFDT